MLLMLLPFGPLNVAFPTLLRATSSSCASCLRDLCLEGLISVSKNRAIKFITAHNASLIIDKRKLERVSTTVPSLLIYGIIQSAFNLFSRIGTLNKNIWLLNE